MRSTGTYAISTTLGESVKAFVPPPPERIANLLADLERFIHAAPGAELPPLVKIALIHAQFETIHPFLDGNGRIGRLLITALLEHWGLLSQPLMHLSGYLKQHQSEYYRRHRQSGGRSPSRIVGIAQGSPGELPSV